MTLRRSGGSHLAGSLAVLVAMVVIAVVPALGAGATTTPSPAARSLEVDLPQPLVGCDPVGRSVPSSTQQLLSLVLPSAYVTSPRGVIQQANSFLVQAEVHSLSPLVVAYTLRSGSRWSDGVPISVADFVATWRDGAAGTGPAQAQYQLISSISSRPGSSDVVVTFREPTSAWQSLFSPLLPAQVRPAAFATCSTPSAAVDLSAGPYVLTDVTSTHAALVRNPSWWGSTPAFDPLVIEGGLSLADAQPAPPQSLVLSQASWLSPDTLASITSAPAVSSTLDFSNRLVSADFNTSRQGTLPLEVRLGIAGLIDRSAVVAATADAIYPSVEPATSHLLTQGLPNYPQRSSIPPLAAASATPTSVAGVTSTTISSTTTTSPFELGARTLRKAGYQQTMGRWTSASGVPLSLVVGVPTDDRWAMQAALAVGSQLAAQGIGVRFLSAPGSFEIAQWLQRGVCDVGIIVRTTDALPVHAAAWFTVSKGISASPLWAGFNDPQLNSMARAAGREMNAQTAVPIYQAIDQRLWALMPSLPLLTEPAALVWTSSIDGISLNPYPPGTLAAIGTWKVMTSQP